MMQVFAQIKKVDEAKRLVYGRAAQETVDKADEVMDYVSSKPHFQKWSEDIAKDTGGKSLGNLRAMHGKVAAGKLTGIEFNDAEKAIDVVAKVVDDAEWKKVLEGVYTGFSIGGSYVGAGSVEKMDGRDVKRYTANPSELSLVDRPCIPSARFFEVQKADGSLQKVDFVAPEPELDVTVNGTADEVAALGKLMNEHGLTLTDLVEKAVPAFLADKKKPKADADDPDVDDKDPKAEDAEKLAAAAALAKIDTDADEALAKLDAAMAEVLAKVGARNSAADKLRLQAVHDHSAALGADCAGAAEKLAKADPTPAPDLQKLVADAIGPLQKLLDDQALQIKKLNEQPAPARISLRAVSKAQDVAGPESVEKLEIPVVRDASGKSHDAASLIKMIHRSGGAPLAMPDELRK